MGHQVEEKIKKINEKLEKINQIVVSETNSIGDIIIETREFISKGSISDAMKINETIEPMAKALGACAAFIEMYDHFTDYHTVKLLSERLKKKQERFEEFANDRK